jgi:Ca2+-binding RTX toxin-like protein
MTETLGDFLRHETDYTPSMMAKRLLIAITILLWAPCSSLGATVRPPQEDGTGARFVAASGETNHLRVWTDVDAVIFTDTRNRVVARALKHGASPAGRCEQVSVHTVRCGGDHAGVPWVRLGDRNDRVKVTGEGALVDGGRGDDVVVGTGSFNGGAGNDTLRGGPGDDGLTGGPGRDVVYGGGGDDSLGDGETDSQAAVDRFDGGPQGPSADDRGGDMLIYERRRGDLRIDLAAGTWSTEDTIVGVESAISGAGNDVLTGDAGKNWFSGGAGDDLISGGGGPDRLDGETGSDVIFGGGGPDRLRGREGDDRLFGEDGNDDLSGNAGADALAGGSGDDDLDAISDGPDADALACDAGTDSASTDRFDTVADCETVNTNGVNLGAVPTIDADSADFTLECLDAYEGCTGTISLSGPDGQPYGDRAFSIAGVKSEEPTRAVVAVPLTAAARSALQGGTLVQVDVIAQDPDSESGGYRIFLPSAPS